MNMPATTGLMKLALGTVLGAGMAVLAMAEVSLPSVSPEHAAADLGNTGVIAALVVRLVTKKEEKADFTPVLSEIKNVSNQIDNTDRNIEGIDRRIDHLTTRVDGLYR